MAFLKELKQDTYVAGQLDRFFRTVPEGWELDVHIRLYKEGDDAFHPSSSYMCAREQYAKRMGHLTKESISYASQKTFLYGHYAHAVIQKILVEELGIAKQEDIEKERRWETEKWWLRGFIDIAHCDSKGEDVLVDIKTVGGQMFRQPNLPPDMWNKYYYQLQLYLFLEDQQTGVLLCWEKDSPHRFKEYVIQRNDDLIDDIFDRWDLVMDAIAAEEPPACDCHVLNKRSCSAKGLY